MTTTNGKRRTPTTNGWVQKMDDRRHAIKHEHDTKAGCYRYHLSLPTVYRWVREGKMPAVQLGKRVLRFSERVGKNNEKDRYLSTRPG
jgi:hypothetical protein